MRVAVMVNTDFADAAPASLLGSRADPRASTGPRAYEADAAVLDTAAAIEDALRRLGHEVTRIEVRASLSEAEAPLAELPPGVVFNLVESLAGDYGREWQVPRWLGRKGLPYTGNGPLALLLCAAKDRARRALTRAGVPVARAFLVRSTAELAASLTQRPPFPLFVKPARVDGSIGIDAESIVADEAALLRRVGLLEQHLPGPFLVEAYLPGKELNVAIFPGREAAHVVPTEIDFSAVPERFPRIVTYDSKWNPESPEYVSRSVPAQLSAELAATVADTARRAFAALAGRAYGRIDMRLDEHGKPHVIDVNPNNDLHPEAGLASAARSLGLSYEELVASIVARAQVGPR